MDIINVAGNVAENMLEGRNTPISLEEFEELWADRDTNGVCFIDTRVDRDAAPTVTKFGACLLNIPQDEIAERLNEVPADTPVVLICNTGLRSFEAQLELAAKGRKDNVRSVPGGWSSVKKLGIEE
jgi:rhodanese-related sulfurtransferase